MYYNTPTLADITVEQYSAMASALSVEENSELHVAHHHPAPCNYKTCSQRGYSELFGRGIIRWRDNEHYILTHIGVALMERVNGYKYMII